MITYLGAIVALLLSAVIIFALLRQQTFKAFQKRLFVYTMILLVCAIISNLLISLFKMNLEDSLIISKKVQATFDILMGIFMGAFVVVTATPKINSRSDFYRHITKNFPSSFVIYLGIMVVGLIGVAATSATVVFYPNGGYTFEFPAWFLVIITVVDFTVICYVPYKLVGYLKRARPDREIVHDTYLIIAGLNGYTILELIFEIVLPSLGLDLRNPGFIIKMVFIAMVAVAIREKRFLQDLLLPIPEADLNSAQMYNLPSGLSYLLEETKPVKSFEILVDLVTHGAEGLIITRSPPEKIVSQYGLEKTPILWLSRVAEGKACIRPYPVGKISQTIGRFVAAGERCVVLLDGLEYLILHNDFRSVLVSLQDLNERIAQHNAILLVPLDPQTLESWQFALIRREFATMEEIDMGDREQLKAETREEMTGYGGTMVDSTSIRRPSEGFVRE